MAKKRVRRVGGGPRKARNLAKARAARSSPLTESMRAAYRRSQRVLTLKIVPKDRAAWEAHTKRLRELADEADRMGRDLIARRFRRDADDAEKLESYLAKHPLPRTLF